MFNVVLIPNAMLLATAMVDASAPAAELLARLGACNGYTARFETRFSANQSARVSLGSSTVWSADNG